MDIKLNMKGREDHELLTISKAADYSAAKFILEDTATLRDKLRNGNETSPKRSPGDLTQDFVYIQGAIAMANAILDASEQAGKINIKRGESHGR